MNVVKLESVGCPKDLGVVSAPNIKFSQQCKDVAGEANTKLDFINTIFSLRNKYVILPLCIRLVRPYLQYANSSGRPTIQRVKQNLK